MGVCATNFNIDRNFIAIKTRVLISHMCRPLVKSESEWLKRSRRPMCIASWQKSINKQKSV